MGGPDITLTCSFYRSYISLKRIENYKSYIGHSLIYSRRFGVFDILLTLYDNTNKPKNLSCRRICIIINKTHVLYRMYCHHPPCSV